MPKPQPLKVAIAKDSRGRPMIRAYRTPAQLARWASSAIFDGKLEIVNADAKLADLQPYREINFTGASFTEGGVYAIIIGNDNDVYRVES